MYRWGVVYHTSIVYLISVVNHTSLVYLIRVEYLTLVRQYIKSKTDVTTPLVQQYIKSKADVTSRLTDVTTQTCRCVVFTRENRGDPLTTQPRSPRNPAHHATPLTTQHAQHRLTPRTDESLAL